MMGRQRGFALVIVLWVLAGLTVVAVAVAASLRTSAVSVTQLRERVKAEAAFLSSGARLRLILATAGAGINRYDGARGVVFADGRPTAVDGAEQWLTVTDLRGIVSLNRPNEMRLKKLLALCGVPESSTSSLTDALLDYTDTDNLKRLNGAEAFEYAGTDLPPPRNAPLLSREELWRVKGWAEIRGLWKAAGCDDAVTVQGDGLFNRNTAALRGLLADGMPDIAAEALIKARVDGLTDLTLQTIDARDASNPFNFAGGGKVGPAVRLVHAARWVEWVIEAELELTPSRDGGPWRVHETRTIPRPPVPRTFTASLPPANFWNPERESELNNAAASLPFGN